MKKPIVCAALFAAVLALLFAVPAVQCVSFSARKHPSERVFSRSALGGFVISYTHSVNKGRVHDYYTCSGGMIVLNKTVFVSYGAGIPEASETEGARFELTADGYAITNMNRRLKSFVMAVGVVAEHTISVSESASGERDGIPLKTIFAPQTSVIVEIKRVPVLPYLFATHI